MSWLRKKAFESADVGWNPPSQLGQPHFPPLQKRDNNAVYSHDSQLIHSHVKYLLNVGSVPGAGNAAVIGAERLPDLLEPAARGLSRSDPVMGGGCAGTHGARVIN